MSPEKERKFLIQALKSIEAPRKSWSWPVFVLMATAFAVLAFLAAWIFDNPSSFGAWQIVALVCTFLSGAIVGGIGFWYSLCKKGALIRPYIDKASMRVRLAELEA